MPRFRIAQFNEGAVYCGTWDYPRAGQRVGLTAEHGDLVVWIGGGGEVSYTWPRDPHPHDDSQPFTPHDQAWLAIRHYQRRTGRDPFGRPGGRPLGDTERRRR